MTPINKYYLKRIFLLPLGWFGLTLIAGAITLYHGYAVYFIYLIIVLTFVAVCGILSGKASKGMTFPSFIFYIAFILSCIAFNTYGLAILFFPQWNGWNGWSPANGWAQVYFHLPADFNYAILLIFLGLILVYGGKKFFEIDLEAMKNKARKRKEVMQQHVYFIDSTYKKEGSSFEIIFKPKFLVRSEKWVHAAILFVACYVILPFGSAAGGIGSSMARDGNSPIIATIFFVFGYFFLCFCVYILIGAYAQYKIIWAMEKELGVKLQPALSKER